MFCSYRYTPVVEDFQSCLWMYCVEKAFIRKFYIKEESLQVLLRICSPFFLLAVMMKLKGTVLKEALPYSFTGKKVIHTVCGSS